MDDIRKAPEMPPEHPPETTGTRWLPIAEVEDLIGKKERNARYWLNRHAIAHRGDRPKLFSEAAILAALEAAGQDHRKAPERPPESTGIPTPPPPEATGTSDPTIEGVYRVLPDDIERAIARTGERYVGDIQTVFGQVAALYDQRLAEKDTLIATIRDEKDALIGELRRRAEVAEAALATAEAEKVSTAAPQPSSVAEAPPASVAPLIAPAPVQGFWQRLRRAISGE